jgi:hypothetical protein
MFKVFVLLPEGDHWKVVETVVVASKADAKTESRRLRREHKGHRPFVCSYPAGEVPAYIPS